MTIYSGFSHWTWWFSIAMLVDQRVSIVYCIYMWFHTQPDLHIEIVPINWAHFEGQPHWEESSCHPYELQRESHRHEDLLHIHIRSGCWGIIRGSKSAISFENSLYFACGNFNRRPQDSQLISKPFPGSPFLWLKLSAVGYLSIAKLDH